MYGIDETAPEPKTSIPVLPRQFSSPSARLEQQDSPLLRRQKITGFTISKDEGHMICNACKWEDEISPSRANKHINNVHSRETRQLKARRARTESPADNRVHITRVTRTGSLAFEPQPQTSVKRRRLLERRPSIDQLADELSADQLATEAPVGRAAHAYRIGPVEDKTARRSPKSAPQHTSTPPGFTDPSIPTGQGTPDWASVEERALQRLRAFDLIRSRRFQRMMALRSQIEAIYQGSKDEHNEWERENEAEVRALRENGRPHDAQQLSRALLSARFQYGDFELVYKVDSGDEIFCLEGLDPTGKKMRELLSPGGSR